MTETTPAVAPVATVPALALAVDLYPELATEVAEVLPLLTLAGLDRVHVLRVETRTEGETRRARMRCDCGRNSYLHDWALTEAALPTPVREALRRHNKRAEGKALRVIKGNPALAARLAASQGEAAPQEALPTAESVVTTADDGEGERYARVTVGRGAVAHLTEDGVRTLCGREGDLREGEGASSCRTCEGAREED